MRIKHFALRSRFLFFTEVVFYSVPYPWGKTDTVVEHDQGEQKPRSD